MAMGFKVKLVLGGCLRRLSKLVSGRRGKKQVAGESFGRLVSLCFSERFVSSMPACLQGHQQQSSCSFEGQYTPHKARPPHQRRKHWPLQQQLDAVRGRSNAESTDLQNCGKEGRLATVSSMKPCINTEATSHPSSQVGT